MNCNNFSEIRAMNIVRPGIFCLSGNILSNCGQIICVFIMFIAAHYTGLQKKIKDLTHETVLLFCNILEVLNPNITSNLVLHV